jgi:hypothetical protein
MDEMMMRYIFKHMRITESRLEVMTKVLARQGHINKNLTTASWLMMFEVVLLSGKVYTQGKRIAKLEHCIKELKHSEGE